MAGMVDILTLTYILFGIGFAMGSYKAADTVPVAARLLLSVFVGAFWPLILGIALGLKIE